MALRSLLGLIEDDPAATTLARERVATRSCRLRCGRT